MEKQEETLKTKKEKKPRPVLKGVLLGILALVVLLIIGSFAGYQSGQNSRFAKETQDAAVEAYIQYEAAMSDLEYGRCEIAQTRLEFVVKSNPAYPGITEALTKAILCSNATATPVPVVQPTAVPTPESRDASAIMAEAESLYANGDWKNLVYQLDAIRGNYPDEDPVRIDQMYYTAYRQIGMNSLLKEGNLEGGIYNFTTASKYGPLDAEAQNYSQWASWYLTGMSFWEVDWGQALEYLQQVAYAAPHLWDGEFTASQRYEEAGQHYGERQIDMAIFYLEVNGYCAARNAFNVARDYVSFNEEVSSKSSDASQLCSENPDSQPMIQYPN